MSMIKKLYNQFFLGGRGAHVYQAPGFTVLTKTKRLVVINPMLQVRHLGLNNVKHLLCLVHVSSQKHDE